MFSKQDGLTTVVGLNGNYVDDGINAGNEAFEQLTQLTLENPESMPHLYDNFKFDRSDVSTTSTGIFQIHQPRYAANLKPLP